MKTGQPFTTPDGQLLEYHNNIEKQHLIPIQDERRSVVAAWNMEEGRITQLATYSAEGRLTQLSQDEGIECLEQDNPGTICAAPGGMPFAFNGLWRSPTTGFVNMRARWYSPRMGEFLSHDPLGYVDLYNLYGFASYDPINGWDPYGTETTCFMWQCNGFFENLNPALETMISGADLFGDQDHKDRVQTKRMQKIFGDGLRKDATFQCKFGCNIRMGARFAYSLVDVLDIAAGASRGAMKAGIKGGKGKVPNVGGKGGKPPKNGNSAGGGSGNGNGSAGNGNGNGGGGNGNNGGAGSGGEDTISIYKAPQRGKGADQFENGFNPANFCDGNKCAYFAKDLDLAEEYYKLYGNGIIELKIPKSEYQGLLKYEQLYDSTRIELKVPHKGFDILNRAERIWHK